MCTEVIVSVDHCRALHKVHAVFGSFWTINSNYFSATWGQLISGRRAAAGLLMMSRPQSSYIVLTVLDESLTEPPPGLKPGL